MKNKDTITIEQKIADNRATIDYHKPPKDMWARISAELPAEVPKKSNIRWLSIIAIAASFLTICSITLWQVKSTTSTFSKNLDEVSQFYSVKYNTVYNDLNQKNLVNPRLERALNNFSKTEEELKLEIENSYGTEKQEMTNRLIEVYRTRIQLLEKIDNKSTIKTTKNEKYIDI